MARSEAPIERLALADLADAGALVAEAGWNQVAADWRIFLDFGTAYAVRSGGRVIATAATLPYGRCAWISMVLVSAGHRRQGLATRLLHRCISDIEASGLVPVLDATPAGAKVYAPLGFEAAWGFTRLAAQRHSIEAPQADAIAIRPIADADWAALCAYDVAIFGADRSGVLARMRGRLAASNLVAQRGGRIAGMLLGRDGRTAAHLGPLIAEDDAIAQALLAQALRAIAGPVYIDVVDAKSEVRGFLEASGFAAQRPFTRMLLGRRESFDDLSRTYAVIGPEFG
jgi:GNAT superfamily N-acetyltransferase